MATFALAAAVSHAPGLTGWLYRAPEVSQQAVYDGFAGVERLIDDADLDVLVVVANDHLANARVTAYPDFTVAMAARHEGPDEWFKPWLKVADYRLRGHPEAADHIFLQLTARGFPVYASTRNLRYDDNVSVPTTLLHLEGKDVAVVPILQNCTVPPIPDERHCYEFGRQLRAAIEEIPGDVRVGLLATGGMAHEPGGPRYFLLDEEFDRHFLELLREGDHQQLLKEATLERMEEVGAGGTAELLSWIIVAAAAGDAPCTPVFYDPIETMRCGIGAATWDLEVTR